MIQAMPLNVHAFSGLGERGETPWNPPGADSEAVGQRFESSRAHHLRFLRLRSTMGPGQPPSPPGEWPVGGSAMCRREALHRLVDSLPEEDLTTAGRLL